MQRERESDSFKVLPCLSPKPRLELLNVQRKNQKLWNVVTHPRVHRQEVEKPQLNYHLPVLPLHSFY